MGIAFSGILFGVGLSILIGPVLFLYLELGVSRGFRAGLALAGGVWISDALIIYVMYNFLAAISNLIKDTSFEYIMGGIGGLLLILFGLIGLYRQHHETRKTKKARFLSAGYFALFVKGFILNSFNPFAFFFWIGVMGSIVVKSGFDTASAWIFFSSLIGTVMILDMLKIYLAKRIRVLLTPKHVFLAKRVVSFALVIFGIGLIIRVVM